MNHFTDTMADIVQTVLGPISPNQLGRTLPHEHLAMDFSHFYRNPPAIIAAKFQSVFSMDRVGYLKQYPYSSAHNLLLNDQGSAAAVLNDVREYKRCGGGTIVENSTEGLKRKVNFYRDVSQATGIHIVAGTGYYIAEMQSDSCLRSGTEELYNQMMREMAEGCTEDTNVKAGFLGEIASVWPLRDFERKVIKAVGELQPQLACGVSFHPHRDPEAPFEIIRLYLEAGGTKDKAVMSHLDRCLEEIALSDKTAFVHVIAGTLLEDESLLEFSKLGTYCQLDLFGVEVSYYQLNSSTDMPSDAQRLQKIRLLADEGKADKILMSHDIHTKHRLIDYGGHGYCHILNNVLPKMRLKGFTEDLINQITIDNPARWLAMPPLKK